MMKYLSQITLALLLLVPYPVLGSKTKKPENETEVAAKTEVEYDKHTAIESITAPQVQRRMGNRWSVDNYTYWMSVRSGPQRNYHNSTEAWIVLSAITSGRADIIGAWRDGMALSTLSLGAPDIVTCATDPCTWSEGLIIRLTLGEFEKISKLEHYEFKASGVKSFVVKIPGAYFRGFLSKVPKSAPRLVRSAETEIQEPDADLEPTETADSYYSKGVALINNDKTEDAVEALKTAVAIAPSHAEAHYLLGISLLSLSRIELSIKHLKKYVEIKPEGDNAAVARSLINSLKPASGP